MDKVKINKYYKILSIVTLVASLVLLFLPNEQGIPQKLGTAFGVNLSFHLVFQFLSRVPYGFSQLMEKENSSIANLANKLLKGFSTATMLLAVIGTLGLLYAIISEQYYERMIMITLFAGVFLGGYASKLKLNNK